MLMDDAIFTTDLRPRLAAIDTALRSRDIGRASQMADALTADHPHFADGWIASARCSQMRGDYHTMRAHLATALVHAPGSPLARLLDAEALIHLGDIREARDALAAMEVDAVKDPGWLGRLAESYSQCGDYAEARRCFLAALALDETNAGLRYGLAATHLALGDIDAAEAAYDALLAAAPHDYDAYYNRATLRTQREDKNHIKELRRMIAAPHRSPMASVQLNYALAKELEDLGRDEESFEALRTGAKARRSMMGYRVEKDLATMSQIAKVFDGDFCTRQHAGCNEEGPVFVLGLPRSGTTLVDRILSSHDEVESLGELNDFALALTSLCREANKPGSIVEIAAELDMAALGRSYLGRARQRSEGRRLFIDKAPGNFLYIGLIAAALPNARIVHLNRDPMDNAYSMYKALFRMGYPFSYDYADLAAYMKAKDKLMAHWRSVLPGRIIDVTYEDVVADQEAQTRALLNAVGLDWDPACLDFHSNTSPSATHSASQVRKPLYAGAVGRWRRFESQLAPLAALLGVD